MLLSDSLSSIKAPGGFLDRLLSMHLFIMLSTALWIIMPFWVAFGAFGIGISL
jgi:hypothetical protein